MKCLKKHKPFILIKEDILMYIKYYKESKNIDLKSYSLLRSYLNVIKKVKVQKINFVRYVCTSLYALTTL